MKRTIVARKRHPHERKLRTREHILADLSVNYVERRIFLCGFAVNRLTSDYGLDLMMLTTNDHGEIENGYVMFQVKSTDSLQIHKDGQSFSLRVEVADLKYWQDEDMPVILLVYDGRTDKAWWLNVQKYLNETNVVLDALPDKRDRLTLRIPLKNRLLQRSIVRFRQFRNEALRKRRVVSDE